MQRARGADWDLRCARSLHRAAGPRVLRRVLTLASRAADAPSWALLFVALWFVPGGPPVVLDALLLAALNLALYWLLKRGTRRQRPFRSCAEIRQHVVAPDAFSFPSGHTLHACAFALLLSSAWPSAAPLLWSFAVLVGASRVVLGVHYPSDVAAGALIGVATAMLVIGWG